VVCCFQPAPLSVVDFSYSKPYLCTPLGVDPNYLAHAPASSGQPSDDLLLLALLALLLLLVLLLLGAVAYCMVLQRQMSAQLRLVQADLGPCSPFILTSRSFSAGVELKFERVERVSVKEAQIMLNHG
jgi:hypothetical protein